jgi:hypothetical protein
MVREEDMPDDKADAGNQDRTRVSTEQPYEIDHFAQKHGISRDEARAILSAAGPSREKADAAAERARQASSQQQQ